MSSIAAIDRRCFVPTSDPQGPEEARRPTVAHDDRVRSWRPARSRVPSPILSGRDEPR
ncbi:hypothetical protein [Phenylobacterium sp.]|uniref:hypothetical protein n=1 Tax=Phenylobacterium sp. TaxID=1871053 RepID=UPI002EDA4568